MILLTRIERGRAHSREDGHERPDMPYPTRTTEKAAAGRADGYRRATRTFVGTGERGGFRDEPFFAVLLQRLQAAALAPPTEERRYPSIRSCSHR